MDFCIPNYVKKILNRLETAGFEAFIVGGSVRDLILNKTPSDYDVTTSATPDEIGETFKEFKNLTIGKQFGTIVVVQPEGNVEVTTYRNEGEYLDGRRPSVVTFSKDINEDLSRRDFTINSIAYNEKLGIVDPFNGKDDIKNRIIRTVGNPKERLGEDYLRIFRAVRFSTQLEFTIEQSTYEACRQLSSYLKNISVERIRDELFKILISNQPSMGIRLMLDLGILDVVIPELLATVGYDQENPNHNKTLLEHIFCVLDNTPAVIQIRMAALLHDIAKPVTFSMDEKGIGHFFGHDKLGSEVAKEILIRLKCSNEFIEKVTILIREHMHHRNMKSKGIKRQLSRVGKENIFDLFELRKADMKCKNENQDISVLEEIIDQIKEILDNNEPYEKSHLNIDGNDIMELGIPQGKEVGEILDYLTEKLLVHPEYNEKEKLIKMIKERGK